MTIPEMTPPKRVPDIHRVPLTDPAPLPTERVVRAEGKARDRQHAGIRGIFRRILEFIAPPRPVTPGLSNSEVQRELKAIAKSLEADSGDRLNQLSAKTIRRELSKMTVLEQQLNALLKG